MLNIVAFLFSSIKKGSHSFRMVVVGARNFNFLFAFFLAACFSVHVLLPGFCRLHLVPLRSFANCFLLLPQFCLTLS